MNDEEIVAALAEALDNLATGLWMGPGWGRIVAAALLPTVRHIAEQRAAEHETEVLTRIGRLLGEWPNAASLRSAIREVLRNKSTRAAALTATPNHRRNAT